MLSSFYEPGGVSVLRLTPYFFPLGLLLIGIFFFQDVSNFATSGAGHFLRLNPSSLSNSQTSHIVFTLCGGVQGGSSPAPTALKSVLLSSLMHKVDEKTGNLSGRLHLHLVMDKETTTEWKRSIEDGSDGPFRDTAKLWQRHENLFQISLYSPEDIWRQAQRAFEDEASRNGLKASSFSETDIDENAWKRCAALRLIFPMAFAFLHHFIYLDFDTVTLCSIDRLGAFFDKFDKKACFGFASEDPSGGGWPTWYTSMSLPVGIPGGVNTGVMLVDSHKLSYQFTFRRYWDEILRIIGEGIYAPTHGKFYGTVDLPSLGDQDILNLLFVSEPTLLHLLPSQWNTLQPAGRIRVSAPAFEPLPPCIMHFSAGSFGREKISVTLGNGAFRFVRDWEVR